ncbi:MAG: hypothetical protein ACRC41_15005 [Sarcina sp.]
MRVNKNTRNEIVVSYLNGKDIFSLASKYNQDVSYIKRTIEKYQQPTFKKVFLLDEENISFNLFSKVIDLSADDRAYIFSNKDLNPNNTNIIRVPAPILKFKNSLDYRLIIGIGEVLALHKKDISKNLIEFIIVSNDNIFCEVINSIDVNMSVLKITPDVNNTYNLVKVLKKVEPQLSTPNLSDENNIVNASIKVKKALNSLLGELDENTSLEVAKLFKKDLEKNSPRLSSNLQSLIGKSTPEGNQLFSSLSKLFRDLKSCAI